MNKSRSPGLLLGDSSVGQVPAPAGLEVNRYRATLVDAAGGQTKVLVCDTATGQCWIHHSGRTEKWHDLASPAAAEQAR